ncbi:BldC family transcriptional regulator [Nonomuraea sp. NPDC059194]|uniref:BldC family transcriptional regulator n=1 Tax=Nonomuraea sp. NPDC059194 TaxID=3346764 RepID=UPI0036CB7952
MSIIADLSTSTERLLTSKEVAIVFRVDPKSVARWARIGRLAAIRTPGGRELRYRESDVHAALRSPAEVPQAASA